MDRLAVDAMSIEDLKAEVRRLLLRATNYYTKLMEGLMIHYEKNSLLMALSPANANFITENPSETVSSHALTLETQGPPEIIAFDANVSVALDILTPQFCSTLVT